MAEPTAKVITVTVASGTPVTTNPLVVKSIRWIGASLAGHAVRIEDPSSNLLWRSVAAGSNNIEESITQRLWRDGFKVVTLQSGELDIEYESYFGSSIY